MAAPSFFRRVANTIQYFYRSASEDRYWGWQDICTPSASGKHISTEEHALALSAVWAAVNIIAGCIGYLPLKVYRKTKEGKELAPNHPASDLLRLRPNPAMDALTFRATLQGHALLRGNGYAEIQRDGADRPIALWPLLPEWVTPVLLGDGDMGYVIEIAGREKRRLFGHNMLHLRGLGSTGYVGYSVLSLARESWGLTGAAEEYGARFFGNGAKHGGVLKHPGKLTDEAHSRLRDDWNKIHEGLNNAHRVAILEEGMDFKETSIAPNDAQFLETRGFQREEIANWFGVPVHMLNGQNKPTFASVEQTGIEFQQVTMNRWEKAWENEVTYKLLGDGLFAEFLTAALLRGETLSRYQAYNIAINSGWLTRNEVREAENLNRLEGLDDPLQPLNMAAAGQEPNPEPSPKKDDPEPEPAAARFLPLFADIARRAVTREVKTLRNDRRQPEEFWRRQRDFIADALTPALLAAGRKPELAAMIAGAHVEARQEALAGCNGNLITVLDAWEAGAGRLAEEWLRKEGN